MTTHIIKTWFDGERVVMQQIPESEIYKQEPYGYMSQARCFVHKHEVTEAEAQLYGWVPVYTIPPAAPVPEGWKLVPTEPTDEMLDAAQSRIDDMYRLDAMNLYVAMIETAPTAPTK